MVVVAHVFTLAVSMVGMGMLMCVGMRILAVGGWRLLLVRMLELSVVMLMVEVVVLRVGGNGQERMANLDLHAAAW